jgi:hypothetical protein
MLQCLCYLELNTVRLRSFSNRSRRCDADLPASSGIASENTEGAKKNKGKVKGVVPG